jgi:hypothetical protein
MEEEIWNPVKGYEGRYEVSSFGRVRNITTNKVLLGGFDEYGYRRVNLYLEVKFKTRRIHQLVAIAFLDHTPCGQKLVVNHKDFNKGNNMLSNLEVIPQRENANKKHIPHTSKYTGVFKAKSKKKWTSVVAIKSKPIILGYFESEEEASLYYENAVIAINKNEKIVIKNAKDECTSQYKGVCFKKERGSWLAYASVGKRQVKLGSFKTEMAAHEARLSFLSSVSNLH